MTRQREQNEERSLGSKIGGSLLIMGAAAVAAPGVSDFLAGMQFDPILHTTTIVAAGLLALSIVALASYGLQKPANMTAVNINLCIATILAAALAACYTAGQIIAYTTPIALPHTLGGMLMIKAGTAPDALVGTEVFGTTLAFSAIAVVLFAIGVKMTGLLDMLPEQPPLPEVVSRVVTQAGATVTSQTTEQTLL